MSKFKIRESENHIIVNWTDVDAYYFPKRYNKNDFNKLIEKDKKQILMLKGMIFGRERHIQATELIKKRLDALAVIDGKESKK